MHIWWLPKVETRAHLALSGWHPLLLLATDGFPGMSWVHGMTMGSTQISLMRLRGAACFDSSVLRRGYPEPPVRRSPHVDTSAMETWSTLPRDNRRTG